MKDYIVQAVNVLQEGGIIIFPTDTAFGIGCAINNKEAVEKLFRLRRRPETQATPVLVSGMAMAKIYLKPVTDAVELLMNKYWPGALTIVYKCKVGNVPSLVRGGRETLGVRMPNYPLILQIIESLGVPILGPSANFHGQMTPFSMSELDPLLMSQVELILPGVCLHKQASTVVDCSETPWIILRQGSIKLNI